MEIFGIGSIGYNIPPGVKKSFKTMPDRLYIAKFNQRLLKTIKTGQDDVFKRLSKLDIHYLFKMLFYGGKWNAIKYLRSKLNLTDPVWVFTIAVNENDIINANKVFDEIKIPEKIISSDDWDIISFVIRYYGIRGEFNEIDSLLLSLNLSSISSDFVIEKPDEILGFLYNLGSMKLRQKDNEQAFQLFELCKIESKLRMHDYWHSQALFGLATYYTNKNDLKKAINILEISINLSKKLQDEIGLVKRFSNLGAFYRIMNKYNLAEKYYQKAYDLALSSNVPINISKGIQANIADIFMLKGDYLKSERIYLEHLKDRRKNQDISQIYYSLNQLGVLNQDVGRLNKALIFFKEGLSLSVENKDNFYEAIFCNNLGRTYFQKGEYSESLSLFKKALNLFKNQKNAYELARVYTNLSVVYFNTGEFQKAKDEVLTGLKYFQQFKDLRGEIFSIFALVDILLSLGSYSEALSECTKALTQSQKVGDKLQISFGLGKMGEIYYYMGDKKAQSYLEDSIEFYQKNELFNMDYSNTLLFLLQILIDQENWGGLEEYLEILLDLKNRIPSKRLEFYVKFMDLLIQMQRGHLDNFLNSIKGFITQTFSMKFFKLYTETILLQIKYYIIRKDFLGIKDSIEDLLKLAEEKKLLPLKLKCEYLQTLLNYYKFNFENALLLSEKNIRICKEKGLTRQLRLFQELQTIIQEDKGFFTTLISSIEKESKIQCQRKNIQISEHLIQSFVENELRFYIPEEQNLPY